MYTGHWPVNSPPSSSTALSRHKTRQSARPPHHVLCKLSVFRPQATGMPQAGSHRQVATGRGERERVVRVVARVEAKLPGGQRGYGVWGMGRVGSRVDGTGRAQREPNWMDGLPSSQGGCVEGPWLTEVTHCPTGQHTGMTHHARLAHGLKRTARGFEPRPHPAPRACGGTYVPGWGGALCMLHRSHRSARERRSNWTKGGEWQRLKRTSRHGVGASDDVVE